MLQCYFSKDQIAQMVQEPLQIALTALDEHFGLIVQDGWGF